MDGTSFAGVTIGIFLKAWHFPHVACPGGVFLVQHVFMLIVSLLYAILWSFIYKCQLPQAHYNINIHHPKKIMRHSTSLLSISLAQLTNSEALHRIPRIRRNDVALRLARRRRTQSCIGIPAKAAKFKIMGLHGSTKKYSNLDMNLYDWSSCIFCYFLHSITLRIHSTTYTILYMSPSFVFSGRCVSSGSTRCFLN